MRLCNSCLLACGHTNRWSPNLSMLLPQLHVFGGGGHRGIRSFLWRNMRNSSMEKWLDESVLVDMPTGMEVRQLRREGKCFLTSGGNVGHRVLWRCRLMFFWICFVI